MLISKFFINRPVFASVLSVLVFLAGLLTMFHMPISEYPEVSPPSIVVSAQYPGANPKVIAETVAIPLEEQLNGVENLLYMSSQSTTDGRMTLRLTFTVGTDPDLAQQLVQNRVSQALPRLPDVTRQLGVTTVKRNPDLTMVVHLTSPNNRYSMLYMRNYALLNIKDELTRIKGIGQVRLFGSGDYAMRIWLNPEKIAERNLTAGDVITAIREQNIQAAAGIIGGAPYADFSELEYPVNIKGRLETPEEFENIIISTGENGQLTKLRDIARVEMGAAEYALRPLLDNREAVSISILAAPGANALGISRQVRAKMAELKESFPEGIEYSIVYDPTVFVEKSIKAVIKTLLEALLLVVLVVLFFLQRWRAAIIPLLAVPVSIVGTFTLLYALGFSINVLTLFGLILSIGIVVDDAIIVVENVVRNIERGLPPREASLKAMREVTGPIITTTLVLVAIFVPIAFISGLTGQFYRQFSLTIAISTTISAFNSLTLSPALARFLLETGEEKRDLPSRGVIIKTSGFFQHFNRIFNRCSSHYSSSLSTILKRRGIALSIYGLLLVVAYGIFKSVPSGFVPMQDKQYLVGFVQLPDGAILQRTEKVVREMSDIAMRTPGVAHAVAFSGISINGFSNSASAGLVFICLDEFEKRTEPSLSGLAISQHLQQKYNAIEEAIVAIFPPPSVPGLGAVGGFNLQIEDRTDRGYEALQKALNAVMAKARATPEIGGVFSTYKTNMPQLVAELDREKAKQQGLNIAEIFETMQIYLGSLYVNDFNKFGRTYQVIAQADKAFRNSPQDILTLKLRNQFGEMVPLGTILSVDETFGPESAQRYNAFRAAGLNGKPAAGYSSEQALAAITRILGETLPKGMQFEWTNLTYQQILAGNTTTYVIGLVVLLVFLVLAAQYESLALPLAIIMIVPMGMLSALTGVWLTGGDNNIFTQISLFVLIGLASKNSILIVEFARDLEQKGRGMMEAVIEASALRLRPILMTSFAFIMGVLPMALSTGAGAEMRTAMGVAVFAGMLGVTFLGIFFTPVFYVLLRRLSRWRKPPAKQTPHPVIESVK